MPNTSSSLKLLSAFLIASSFFWAGKALAWGAVAAWDGRYSYVSTGYFTREEAVRAALEGCRKVVMEPCELMGDKAVTVTAIVIARDVAAQQMFLAARTDPLEAAQSALRSCRLHARECVIIQAVWEPGPLWWAAAESSDFFHLHINAQTEKEAREEALGGCESGTATKGSCEVTHACYDSAYFAMAADGGAGWGKTREEAEKFALQECTGEGCRITWHGFNRGLATAPESFAKVEKMAEAGVARLRKEGRWID